MTGLLEHLQRQLELTAEVADIALQGVYPGIEIQHLGWGWNVRLPNLDGTYATATASRLREAIELAVKAQVRA
jgi:hypothetical protein